MHESEIWITRIFNDHLAGLGNALLNLGNSVLNLLGIHSGLHADTTSTPIGECLVSGNRPGDFREYVLGSSFRTAPARKRTTSACEDRSPAVAALIAICVS